jgi:hypothetical protein
VPRPVRTLAVVVGAALGLAGRRRCSRLGTPRPRSSALRSASRPDTGLLISDSAWLGIKTYGAIDAVQGEEHMLDLASCRRRVSPSCRNYDGHVPITLYEELEWRGRSFHTLVVATGYNDSDRNFRAISMRSSSAPAGSGISGSCG